MGRCTRRLSPSIRPNTRGGSTRSSRRRWAGPERPRGRGALSPRPGTFTFTSRFCYDSRAMTVPTSDTPRLLRINEVAAETGLTTRAIRYYEEVGLLEPAARSEGDYRLYDESDLERLRYIRSLRDDAGFSLAQIGQLLEDEAARERNRERFRATRDPD